MLPFTDRIKSQAWFRGSGLGVATANYVYKGDLRDTKEADGRHRKLRRCVSAMSQAAPGEKQEYYENTLVALDEMRAAIRFG